MHPENTTAGAHADARDDRLDSWKEIAAYLRRSERTVHRWETLEGLPVHRYQGRPGSGVFAYRTELDEWLARFDRDGHAHNEGNQPDPRPRPDGQAAIRWAAAAMVVVGMSAAGWYILRGGLTRPSRGAATLKRLSADTGLTTMPSLSADGRILAYVSDRAGEGTMDIWVQELPNGSPRRVASGGNYCDPAVSPDGRQVVFGSGIDSEDGLFMVSTSGGAPTRFGPPFARHAVFSPDGGQVAYFAPTSKGSLGVFVVATSGGAPHQIQPEFWDAELPTWSPDGSEILFDGSPAPNGEFDWWIAPVNGGEPKKTGASARLARQGLVVGAAVNQTWAWVGDYVYLVARQGETTDCWRYRVSADGRLSGDAERLTRGTAVDGAVAAVRLPGGRVRVVFASVTSSIRLLETPLDPVGGAAAGAAVPLTNDAATVLAPSLSQDGQWLAYSTDATPMPTGAVATASRGVIVENLKTNARMPVGDTTTPKAYLALARDGSRLAYSTGLDWGADDVYVARVGDEVPKRVCSGCGDPLYWFGDGAHVLIAHGRQNALAALDVDSKEIRDLATPVAGEWFRAGRLSPDDRWIAASTCCPTALHVIPVGSGSTSENDWIDLQGPGTNARPYWSPDGSVLYFTSTRDGFQCIWGQLVDRATGQPLGQSFAVQHSHDRVRPDHRPSIIQFAVGGHRLVYSMREATGNLWSTEILE